MDEEKDKTSAKKEDPSCIWKGDNSIVDEKEMDHGLSLNKGTYKIMSSSFDVRICKRKGVNLESYDHLRDFCHANAISQLDYYVQAKRFGRLVLPKLHFSFKVWFDNGGRNLLFENGHMTTMFENLIMEYCDLVRSLLEKDLVIENFDMDNVFVNVYNEVPTLRVLLSEVTKVPELGIAHTKIAWDAPRKFISWCEDQCQVTRDHLTERFCAFLGKPNCDLATLKTYPHNWDDAMKGEYLMSIVASDHSTLRRTLQHSSLKWPFLKKFPPRPFEDNLPSLLRDILHWDKSRKHRELDLLDFLSYVIVLRNCYKHYKGLPEKIKEILENQNAIIAQIEKWSPDFWVDLYEKIGWP